MLLSIEPKCSHTKYSYNYLEPGLSFVVYIRKLSTWEVKILAKSEIGKVTAANDVPPMLASKVTKNRSPECELSEAQEEQLLARIDLSGMSKWTPEDQVVAEELIKEFASVFLQHDLDLGRMLLVKPK